MSKLNRRWVAVTGGVLTLACVLFFGLQLETLLTNDALDLSWSLPLLPASLAAFLAAYAAFAFGWHLLLLTAGTRPSVASSVGIFATAQFGKYLPGNVGHHIGRVAITTSIGLPAHAVVATMITEVVVVLAWMVLLGLPLFDFWIARLALENAGLLKILLPIGALLVAVGIVAYLLLRKLPAVTSTLASLREVAAHASESPGKAVTAILMILAGILATSFSLALLDPTATLLRPDKFLVLTGLFAAAWLLGFVTPGAPAGVGIREVVLTEGLTPLLGRESSLLVALMFRILSTGADLLVFIAGLGLLWWERHRRVESSSPSSQFPSPRVTDRPTGNRS